MRYTLVLLILMMCFGCADNTPKHSEVVWSHGKMFPRQYAREPPASLPPGWTWQFRYASGHMHGGWMAYPPAPGDEYSWVYGPDGKPIMMHGGKIVPSEEKPAIEENEHTTVHKPTRPVPYLGPNAQPHMYNKFYPPP